MFHMVDDISHFRLSVTIQCRHATHRTGPGEHCGRFLLAAWQWHRHSPTMHHQPQQRPRRHAAPHCQVKQRIYQSHTTHTHTHTHSHTHRSYTAHTSRFLSPCGHIVYLCVVIYNNRCTIRLMAKWKRRTNACNLVAHRHAGVRHVLARLHRA